MIWLGRFSLSFLVKVIIHCSPVPACIAGLSYQSISTPSKLFSLTKVDSLIAQAVGSILSVVGNYVAPKALTSIFTPFLLYFSFRNF